jgi:hypothetical protein
VLEFLIDRHAPHLVLTSLMDVSLSYLCHLGLLDRRLLYLAVSGSDEVKSKHGDVPDWEEDII